MLPRSQARQLDPRGVIGEAARRQLVLIRAQQARQVRARFAALAQCVQRYRVEAQLFKGAGQRPRKSGEARHRPEVAQAAGAHRLLRDARGQRLAHSPAHRHQRAPIQLRGGKFPGQFAE